MDAPPPYDRRVGHRHDVEPVPVGWRLDAGGGSRRRLLGRKAAHAGRLLDLSVSGARVLAPAAKDVMVGTRLVIGILDVTGPVVVRRIEPGSQPGEDLYGLEFADPTSPLTQLVQRDLLAGHAAAEEHHWR